MTNQCKQNKIEPRTKYNQMDTGINFNTSNIFYDPDKDFIEVKVETNFGVNYIVGEVLRRLGLSEIAEVMMYDAGLGKKSFSFHDSKDKVLDLNTKLVNLVDSNNSVHIYMKTIPDETFRERIILGKRPIQVRKGLKVKLWVKKESSQAEINLRETKLLIQPGEQKESNGLIQTLIKWLDPNHHKPFLGGYRNKSTKQVYHNASAQTLPPKRPPPKDTLYCRETQTYRMRHNGQSTVNEMSTQFPKLGFFISNYRDKLCTPGPFETADEYRARVLGKIIIIQKYIRRWLAKRRVDVLRGIRDAVHEAELKHKVAMQREREERKMANLTCQLNPSQASDFDKLMRSLEEWRLDREAKINALGLGEAERKTLLARMLDQQTELLAVIDNYRQEAECCKHGQEKINLLRKAAAALRWTSYRTTHQIHVDTPATIKGKELLGLMCQIQQYTEKSSVEERLQVLLKLKRKIIGHKRQLKVCSELCQLIDRETELMMRGVGAASLAGLRKRIASRFFAYCKVPEVNPQISDYLKVPQGTKKEKADKLRGNIHYCPSCGRYLPNSAFILGARSKQLGSCKSCQSISNLARNRIDLEPCNRILKLLRKSEIQLMREAELTRAKEKEDAELTLQEQGFCPTPDDMLKLFPTIFFFNPFPFLMNKQDMRFLIDEIWEHRSILSGCTDIDELVIVRWHQKDPWGPWNTMLVTRQEAEAHAKLVNQNLEEAYAEPLLQLVNQRSVMARNAFSQMFDDGIQMIYELVEQEKSFEARTDESEEFKKAYRRMLPPLAPEAPPLTAADRHKATFQPDEVLLPAIKGETRRSRINFVYEP